MNCKKCNFEKLEIVKSGPHNKLFCTDWTMDRKEGKMREIKFRAWDEKENKMVQITELRMVDGNVVGFDTWFTQDSFAPGNPYQNLMQYTGLKDKNGVEGYHKDKIETPRFVMGKEYGTEIHIVEYKDGCFGVQRGHDFVALRELVEILETEYIPNYGKKPTKTRSLWKVIGNICEDQKGG